VPVSKRRHLLQVGSSPIGVSVHPFDQVEHHAEVTRKSANSFCANDATCCIAKPAVRGFLIMDTTYQCCLLINSSGFKRVLHLFHNLWQRQRSRPNMNLLIGSTLLLPQSVASELEQVSFSMPFRKRPFTPTLQASQG